MSDAVLKRTVLKRSAARSPAARSGGVGRLLKGVGRVVKRVVFSPLRLFLSIRRSMTAASVTLLLIGIITLNIIWGYPWSGLFSACMSLLFVGWAINRAMRPKLQIDFSLPNSSPAEEPFLVLTHVKNAGRLPAMDLIVAFRKSGPGANAVSRRRKRQPSAASADFHSLSPPQSLSLIRPGDRTDLHASLSFHRRGIHRLPDVAVTSMFPFHLFRSSRRFESGTQIAITPRLMTGDEDSLSRAMLNALGGWSRKLLSGDALDYTGSREYVVGMPVRRWDFTSWARLGQPIVREFQSPSIQVVTLIVDTSIGNFPNHDLLDLESLERVLSAAATAVTDLTRKSVRVRLYVTSEAPSSFDVGGSPQSIADSESLLIRLAAAESVSVSDADRRTAEIVDLVGRLPVLVLTARRDFEDRHSMPPSVTVIRVDPPHARSQMSRSSKSKKRWLRWKQRPTAQARSDIEPGG